MLSIIFKIFQMEEFSGGPVVKTWAFTAVDPGAIPGQGTKIPQAVWCGQKRKKEKNNKNKIQRKCTKKKKSMYNQLQ